MPRKWRNRIITCCSSEVNVAIQVSEALLSLDDVTSIQRVGQYCHLASSNLRNSHVISNNFHVSACFQSREKKRETLQLECTTYMQKLRQPCPHETLRVRTTTLQKQGSICGKCLHPQLGIHLQKQPRSHAYKHRPTIILLQIKYPKNFRKRGMRS